MKKISVKTQNGDLIELYIAKSENDKLRECLEKDKFITLQSMGGDTTTINVEFISSILTIECDAEGKPINKEQEPSNLSKLLSNVFNNVS